MPPSSTPADQTVLLEKPDLPRATRPVVGGDFGVPKHIYDQEPAGCKVLVLPYTNQTGGENVSINLNGETNIDNRDTLGIDDTVELYIPNGKLLPGMVNRLTYTVRRLSGIPETSDPPVEILYNQIRPGNEDRSPGDGAHSELELILPDEIKNGIGPGFSRATVCVSYPYCRAHDRIRLNCNGKDVMRTVLESEAPAPPDHGSATPTTICFDVTSADLGEDHPEFMFSFTVTDQLGNSPDLDSPFSAVQIVDVDQAGLRLPVPIPREIASDGTDDPSTIDLDKLGTNPLLLIILTGDSRFLPGDTIEATYVAKVAGQPNVTHSETGTVETDGLGQKQACVLEIPNDKVISGSTVEMSYKLFRGTTLVGTSKTAHATVIGAAQNLLPPSVKEAIGGQIHLIGVPNGATVQIPIEAALKEGDSGLVRWVGLPGAGSIEVPFSVVAGDEGKIKEITVPRSVVEANVNRSITLDYLLQRRGSGSAVPSESAVYDIRQQAGSGRLLVLGARIKSSETWWGGNSACLTAMDATTLQPLEAIWQYEGDTNETSGNCFEDTQAWRLLLVRIADDQIRINPANFCGSAHLNVNSPTTALSAFAARRNNGSVVAWGALEYGGDVPATIRTLTDIVEMGRTAAAISARRANGSVVAWGYPAWGGAVSQDIGGLKNIVRVHGNAFAFAALLNSHQVVAWGDMAKGGTVSREVASLDDIIEVIGGQVAFAARRANGQVVAWGQAGHPSSKVPDAIAGLSNIEKVVANQFAFTARLRTGNIVAWGDVTRGGDVPSTIQTLTDIVEVVASSEAFVARRANGHVVAWGNTAYGSSVPIPIADLGDIVEVAGSNSAFAARRANGRVVAWGNVTWGGNVPVEIRGIDDIVQLSSTGGAFAALRSNGSVVAWGHQACGGDTRAVAGQLTNVRAVYANAQAFAALTADGRVVTWGLAAAGGNLGAAAGELRGHISYLATPASRAAALKTQQQP